MFKFLMMLVAGSFVSVANAQSLKAVKIFDGKALGCSEAGNLGSAGLMIRDVQAVVASAEEVQLQVRPQFLFCGRSGQSIVWREVSEERVSSGRVRDVSGQVYNVQVETRELVVGTVDSRFFIGSDVRKNPVGVVTLKNVLTAQERHVLETEGTVAVPLDLNLRNLIATSSQGQLLYREYGFSGGFRIVLNFKKQNGVLTVSSSVL